MQVEHLVFNSNTDRNRQTSLLAPVTKKIEIHEPNCRYIAIQGTTKLLNQLTQGCASLTSDFEFKF